MSEVVDVVDLVIKCKYLITLSRPNVVTDGAVAIRDGRVVGVGRADDVLKEFRGEEVLERRHHVLLPGFLDGHTHTQQVLLRTSISDYVLQLPPIWTKYLIPFERRLGSELAYISSLLSVAAMAKNGTTYFIEACAPYPEELVKAVNEVGIKGVVTYATYDIFEGEPLNTSEILRRTEELVRRGREGRVRFWCSIREVMMASKELLEGIRGLCRRYGVGITYHLGEYQGEVDYVLSKYGVRPLELLDLLGITDIRPSVIAHAIYFSEREVGIIRRKGLSICWCPTVDSILMGPHWLGIRGDGVRFCLGSDGGAFTTLDLLHEVKVARAVSKALAVSLNYDKVSTLDSLKLLKALTGFNGEVIGEKVGVIKEGYSADLVIMDLSKLNTVPTYDPVEAVITLLESSEVTDVLVDGEFVVRDGKLVKIDESIIKEKVLDALPKLEGIISELKRELKPALTKL